MSKRKATRLYKGVNRSTNKTIDTGMKAIQHCLVRAERRLISIRGGQSLKTFEEREKSTKQRAEEEKEEARVNALEMVVLDPLQDVMVRTPSEGRSTTNHIEHYITNYQSHFTLHH